MARRRFSYNNNIIYLTHKKHDRCIIMYKRRIEDGRGVEIDRCACVYSW